MAPAVEAGSLATVIDLANSPPEHLQYSPAIGVQQPLILYIARVPGSKGWPSLLLAFGIRKANVTGRCLPHNDEAGPAEGRHCPRRAKFALLCACG